MNQELVTLCPEFLAHLRANDNKLKSLDWLEQHVKTCPRCRAIVEEEKESGEDSGSSNQERKEKNDGMDKCLR